MGRRAWLAGMLLAAAVSAQAQPVVKQVLVLQSLDRGNLTFDHFTARFRAGLDQRAGRPVNVVQVVVGPTGFVGASDAAVVDYIRALYAGRPAPDLVMTVGGPAAVFARKHSGQLFPARPLLFASVDQRFLVGAPLGETQSAATVMNDMPRMIDDILLLLPQTRQMFMVIGSGTLGQFWRRELERDFARFAGRLEFVWSDEMTLQDMVHHVASLPKESAIFYVTFGSDVRGGAYGDEQVLADLHAAANAPLFAPQTSLLGHGTVGGSLISIEDLSRNSADVANRILNGAAPASFRLPPQSPGQPTFDWRELQRWNIAEHRLPKDSIVRYRSPTLWDEYRLPILLSIGLLLFQSLLIARLLYERRARHRAEIESLRNLALAADANRRETMSALTTSMGHELAQPLSAVLHNAEALQRMVKADGALPGDTDEILGDIRSGAELAIKIFHRHRSMLRGRQIERKPIDLHGVIEASLGLVARDTREQQIEVTLVLTSAACIVDGDQVLLQQVFLNLLRNAMDALAETPPAARRVTIESECRAAAVDVSVSDTGSGLPAEVIGTLYKPFVTTKAQGLGVGLTVAKSIVTAHGGTIAAHGNPGGGTTFTVTLPRATAPAAVGSREP